MNHKRVLIKGGCIHHDVGCLGSAFEYSAAKRQLESLKSMGVNSIRTGHTPPAPQFMDLADEMGILMDVERDVYKRQDRTQGPNGQTPGILCAAGQAGRRPAEQ